MNKFYLVLVALLIVTTVRSQPAYSFIKFAPEPNGNIAHLATINPGVIEGNNFFADAGRKERQGDFNEALTLFGKAAFEYDNAKVKMLYASALMRMSDLHRTMKNFKAAEDVILNVALKVYTKMGSKTGEMNAYKQLGKIYLDANRFSESLWFFTQQGILAQRRVNKFSFIESVIDIARLKIKRKQYSLATLDVNRAELLAKSAKTSKYSGMISDARRDITQKN